MRIAGRSAGGGASPLRVLPAAALAALLGSAAGCATFPTDPALRSHIVMVDGEGELCDPAGGGEVIPRSSPGDGAPSPREEYFRALFDAMARGTETGLREDGVRKVFLYVHGGLNSPADGIQRAQEVLAAVEADAAAGKRPPFVVFLNWDSSFASCYSDYLFRIRQGKDRGGLWFLAAPFYFAADLLHGVAAAPLLWLRGLESTLAADGRQVEDAEERSQRYRRHGDPSVRRGEDGTAGLPETLQRVLFLPVRALGIPFVYSFGTSSWRTMDRRVSTMFHTEREFTERKGSAAPRAALQDFLAGLQERLADGGPWRVTLAGHSMGALVMNQMLREAPEIHYDRLVFMASACTVRDYGDTVVPYMLAPRNRETQVVHLMLADRNERVEKFWNYVDVVPRGSLLAWIDDYLSTPPTRLDRTAGRFVNLVTAPESILRRGGVGARTLLWQFDGGDPGQPRKHEDFDEVKFRFWEDDWWTRLPGGSPPRTGAHPGHAGDPWEQ